MSNIKLCGAKNSSILHPPVGQLATGVPKLDVSILLALDDKLLGTLDRLKNQILIPDSAYSVTKTPPPAFANAWP